MINQILLKTSLLFLSVFLLSASSEDTLKVLIIGDSISIGYFSEVKESLSDRANVEHNEGNARHTGYALEKIQEWISKDDYDIILFNWGLHDLCYRHPDSKVYGNRDKVRGQLTHTLEEYRLNLDSLVRIMKASTNAELYFISTSYVPEDEACRFTEDPARYNEVAMGVMQKYTIPVIDIYDRSVAIHEKFGIGSDDVHYTAEGSRELGKLVVKHLEKATTDDLRTKAHPIEVSPLFFGPPTHEYPFESEMTEQKLGIILDNMKMDGIKMVLIMPGWGEKVYYPSKILKKPCKNDWIELAFRMAGERGIQVVLSGIPYTYNDQFTGGTWNPELDLEINKKVYRELFDRYGHHANFWGWYIPHETGDRTHRGNIMVILEGLPGFLKELSPDKIVSFSPWFPSRITLGEEEAMTPSETAAEWDTILSLITGIDIFVFQDSTAPLDELTDYFAAIKPVFDKHEVELWAVIELFTRFQDRPGIDLFRSITPDLLFEKMTSITPYTKRFACWEYQTHLNPDSNNPGTAELNKAYRLWINNKQE
jgi:hypothetical protein